MKTPVSLSLFAGLGLAALALVPSSVRAGAAVASDGHGGFGFSYGNRPVRELRREAIRRCTAKSRYEDEVEIIVSTEMPGAGIILRYRAEGRLHVYAYVGADSMGEAQQYAMEGARDKGAEGRPEVVARWNDQ